ncbi:MAG: hypothetical protein ACI4EF_06765 [Coprococcus sp.]
MLKNFRQNLFSELVKLYCSKVCKIVMLLVIGVQGFLAYIAAKQILSVGLEATPETCPELIEAMPPIEFMGFDVVMFSTIPMIVLGSICGASEYKMHSLRTTLLSIGKKSRVFFAKTFSITLAAFILSLVSVIVTITITHITFGEAGLIPIVFNSTVWKHIYLSVTAITLLTVLAYVFGFLCRTTVFPMMFLIIQAYNIGDILAEHFAICRLLPVSLVNRLIVSSESILTPHPILNIAWLLVWIVVTGVAGFLMFNKSDLRGEY